MHRKIPMEVIRNNKLSFIQKILYMELYSMMNTDRYTTISDRYLSLTYDVDEDEVLKQLLDLEKKGFIEINNETGFRKLYVTHKNLME